MVNQKTITTVLDKLISSPRQPEYLNKKEYAHLLERNKEFYMSSAWYADHWSYKQAQTYAWNMMNDRGYFICGLPYQLPLKEGLLQREAIEDKMSESTYDEVTWSMEMGALFYGDTQGTFFTFSDVSKCRRLKLPMYPPSMIKAKSYKIPDLSYNERRIMSVDVALMASGKHKNDASSIFINSAIPTNDNSYIANIVYTENYEGLTTDELALIVRRLFDVYKCTDLVIDTQSSGLGVFDTLIRDMVDPETGTLYGALSCCNDEAMAARCKVAGAPKVIWSIKGSASLNSEIAIQLRSGLQQGKINLLIEEDDIDDILADKITNFKKLAPFEQEQYKMPYINTTLLVYELTRLEYEAKGRNIKIKEKTGMRKDRYSSLAYNYFVQCTLERDALATQKTAFSIEDYASSFKKMGINRRPVSY